MRQRTQAKGTLYTPPKRPWVPKAVLRWVVLLLGLGGVAAGAWFHPTTREWARLAWDRGWSLIGHEVVTIDVVATPSRVSLFLDGEQIKSLPIHIAKDAAPHTLMAVAPGFEPTTLPIRPTRSQQVIITLKPMK